MVDISQGTFDPWVMASQLLLGIFLAANVGLKAFLPILVINLFSHAGWIHLNPKFAWLGSDIALAVLTVATILEIAGDHIPAVDHALHSIEVVTKPCAAAVLFAGVQTWMDPMLAGFLGLIIGLSIAEILHLGKSSIRAVSSATGNPVLAAGETVTTAVGSVGASLISLLPPPIAALILLVGVFGVLYLIFVSLRFAWAWISRMRSRK